MKKQRIKFPIKLPKGIWKDNHYYKLKSVWLLNDLKWNVYPHQWYVQIHYKNDEWGYNQYFDRFVGPYLFPYLLGIQYEDFRKAERKVLKDMGLKEIVD